MFASRKLQQARAVFAAVAVAFIALAYLASPGQTTIIMATEESRVPVGAPTIIEDTAPPHTRPTVKLVAHSDRNEADVSSVLSALKTCDGMKQPKDGNNVPLTHDVPMWELSDEIIDGVCARHKLPRRRPDAVPKLIYAVMFGLELDMLEVVLHEVVPVADYVFITESTQTHSLGQKGLLYGKVKAQRYAQFEKTGKLRHLIYTPVRQYKSGWDVEKRQRNHFLRHLPEINITDGDIVMGNIDLDEILTRETLIRVKYCEAPNTFFKLVHFRYNLNCVQEPSYTTYFDTMFTWNTSQVAQGRRSKLMKLDLYSRRRNRNSKPIAEVNGGDGAMGAGVATVLRDAGAWHLTAFGGVEAVLAKYRNSPHKFVGELNRDAVVKVIKECVYQDTPRTKLPFDVERQQAWFNAKGTGDGGASASVWPPVPLPYAVTQRPCLFAERGWFGAG